MTCDHHGIMAIAFGMLKHFFKVEEESLQCLLVGLGGGLLVSFLHHYIPTVSIV
jgi:hypothetical protein